MESFIQLCSESRERLGRDLQKEELEFLHWIYERYTEDQLHRLLEQPVLLTVKA